MPTEEELEQKKLEEEAAAAEAEKKRIEEEAAAAGAKKKEPEEDEKKKAAPSLSEAQIQKLEKDTGFTRQQLITLNLMQQGQKKDSTPAELVEDYAFTAAMKDLKSSGVKNTDDLEHFVREELKNIPEAERKNKDVVKNIFFSVAGKRALGVAAKPAPASGGRIITGVDAGGGDGAKTKQKELDISSLDEHEQVVFNRYKFKTMEEWNKYKSRDLDTSYEENWQPDFGRK